jgi:photosystem II stability/assembly factor-like uncharacterized protein
LKKTKSQKLTRHLVITLSLGLLLTIISCEKEREQLPFEEIRITNSTDLKGIHNDLAGTLFVSGGDDDHGVIYISTDSGMTWLLRAGAFDKSVNDVWMDIDGSGFTADKDVLIYSTTDSGSNWIQYYPTTWPLSVNRNLRDICRSDPSTVVICGGKNFGNGLIYVTHDNGSSWSYSEYDHELRGITLGNKGHGLAAGYGVVLRTSDNGDSWTIIDSPPEYFTGITSGTNSTYYLCGFNGGLYSTADQGNSWKNLKKNNSLFSSRDRFTCITSFNNIIVACGENGLAGISKDSGDSWKFYETFNNGNVNDVVILSPEIAIAAGDDGRIYRFRI